MKRFFYICIFLLFGISLCAQKEADSLKGIVNTFKADSIQIKNLFRLGEIYREISPDTAKQYYVKALVIANILDQKAQTEEDKKQGKFWIIKSLRNLGVFYWYQSDYASAIENFEKMLALSQANNDSKNESSAYNNLGLVYTDMGNYSTALDYFQKALKLFEKNDEKQNLSKCYNNIGNIHQKKGNFKVALEYYNMSLQIKSELNDKKGVSDAFANIAWVYFEQKNSDKALEYYQKSLTIKQEIGDVRGIAKCYSNIGNIYAENKNTANALKYYENANKINNEIENNLEISICENNIGALYKSIGDFDKAIFHAKKSLEISKYIGAIPQASYSYSILAECYAAKGEYKEAFENYKNFKEYNDSIYNQISDQKMQEMEAIYQNEKNQQRILLQESELKEQETELSRQRTLRNTFIIGFIVLSGLAFYIYRSNKFIKKANRLLKNQKEEIQNKNLELEKLSIVARETDNAVFICSPEGEIEWVNAGFEKLYCCTFNEYKEQCGSNIYATSSNQNISDLITEAIQYKKSVIYNSSFITGQGENKWFQTTLTPILYKNGELYKLVAIESDITKVKEAEAEILLQKNEIEKQKNTIEKKNIHITDSIRYAFRIQQALFPGQDYIRQLLPNSMIHYQPKDIVSGDFYWIEETIGFYYIDSEKCDSVGSFVKKRKSEQIILFAAVDCTGHGVPGAFMSIMGYNLLSMAIKEEELNSPAEILNFLSNRIYKTLRQRVDDSSVKDGMDIALCALHRTTKILKFSAVHNSGYLVRKRNSEEHPLSLEPIAENEESVIYQLKPSVHPIGEPPDEDFKGYKNLEIPVNKGDRIYLFSDGYLDQFGGPKRQKFMHKRFRELLFNIQHLSMEDQNAVFKETFLAWKGAVEQYDDVLVFGVEV